MSADGDVIRAALDYLWSYAGGPPIEAEGQRSDAVVALARLEAAAESAYSVARMFDAAEENCRDAEANYLREFNRANAAEAERDRLKTDENVWAHRAVVGSRRGEAVEAQRDALAEALRTICDIGETRDVEVARAALADVGLIADSDTTTEWKS